MEKVLVTGGTGFLAGWIIRKLIEQGYSVKTTIISKDKELVVKNMLQSENINTNDLFFVVADLNNSNDWQGIMEDVDYVIHTASPLGGESHNNPQIIDTAITGTKNVINASIKSNIKKVIMTSSQAANYLDKKNPNQEIDENYWTEESNRYLTNYMRSKIES